MLATFSHSVSEAVFLWMMSTPSWPESSEIPSRV